MKYPFKSIIRKQITTLTPLRLFISKTEMKVNKREIIESLLIEGTSDKIYHFASIDSVINMLKNDSIGLTLAQTPDSYAGREIDLNGKYPFFLSLTSTKDFNDGYQGQWSRKNVRLELDGRALMYNHKMKRIAFFSSDNRKVDAKNGGTGGYDEMEDRLLSKNPKLQFTKFVNKVTLDGNKTFSLDTNIVDVLRQLCNRRGVDMDIINEDGLGTEGSYDKERMLGNNTSYTSFDTGYIATLLRLTKAFNTERFEFVYEKILSFMPKHDRFNFRHDVGSGDITIDNLYDVINKLMSGEFPPNDYAVYKKAIEQNLGRVKSYNRDSDVEVNALKIFINSIKTQDGNIGGFFKRKLSEIEAAINAPSEPKETPKQNDGYDYSPKEHGDDVVVHDLGDFYDDDEDEDY